VHHGSLSGVQGFVAAGRSNGTWNSTHGLTSSAAKAHDASDGFESVQLPCAEQRIGRSICFLAGNERRGTAQRNRYYRQIHLYRRFNLDGMVNTTDSGILSGFYGLGNDWATAIPTAMVS